MLVSLSGIPVLNYFCGILFWDYEQWIPLNSVFQDDNGYYMYEPPSARCPRGHRGFKYHMVKRFWTCLSDDCPYNYGKYF